MKTSVIVCSYGGNEDLVESCMASLECQTYQPDEIILVVDTEEEREIYSNSNFLRNTRVICSGKKGLAAARNKGIEACVGDIIAFIDDDAVADENWLYEIVNSFSDDVVVVGGPVKPIFRGREVKDKLNWIIGCTSNSPPTKRPIGCNMAFDKSVFNSIGMFNENLGRIKEKLAIGEETELFLRIKKCMPDAEIVYNPDAIVFHEVPEKRTKLGYMLRRAYEEGLAKAVIGKKYGLDTEQNYLKYYLKHLDFITGMVLFSTGLGYIRGKLRRG
ncbi:MAG TPA: glycosyltransferase [Thermoplasmata archaeon]|nr:glycosyltransferase [Thermoplasmata archaeon]